ncbi:hypothetical protein N7508_004595 [Penicillium antarcticum]|uniref:uncharacterized protein n=1 Tax=Penicillium antarcticum TaxID=416450 RepID=UPI0023A6619F|nr:uncharacterized protein N7508_004595 [Penicillium antarcticum]KAJ5309216.1 hypothetical protein N7508_004595 [Penicillium antarcticum]
MSRPLKHRDIACARCFRLKRKCDHAKPSCGECRRKGVECLPARSRKSGDNITIPLEYLRQLQERVAESDRRSSTIETQVQMCDAGVQTDLGDLEACNDSDSFLAGQDLTPDNDASLMLLSGLQSPSQRFSRSPLSFSPDTWSFLSCATFDFPWMDTTPSYPLTDGSTWLKEQYTNVYFSVTHREWPFMNESAWKSWHNEVFIDGQDEWRQFFLNIVYAIGASLCSTIQRDLSHSIHSKEFYATAMRYYPHVVGHSSMVLQIQASLLMIVYALHSPSSEEITTSVASVVPFCTAAMAEIRKHASICRENGSITEADEVLSEKMFITCYMLNEIIVSGWDRPVSAAYRVVDDDMCILGDRLQPPQDINPALSHLFRLRKIQARIRRSKENWPQSPLIKQDKNHNSSSSFKSALDIWRQDIPRYGSNNVQYGYLHPRWMRKLYDYSLLILMEGKRDFVEDGVDEFLAAIVDVCLNFRVLQEEGHVMCYTWSALVFQFRAGIMLLYIAWATKSMNDTRKAIDACAMNLAGFVDRGTDAMPYMRVYEFLRQKVMWNSRIDEAETNNIVLLEEAETHLEQLKKGYLHRAVLRMVEDIIYGGNIQVFAEEI